MASCMPKTYPCALVRHDSPEGFLRAFPALGELGGQKARDGLDEHILLALRLGFWLSGHSLSRLTGEHPVEDPPHLRREGRGSCLFLLFLLLGGEERSESEEDRRRADPADDRSCEHEGVAREFSADKSPKERSDGDDDDEGFHGCSENGFG